MKPLYASHIPQGTVRDMIVSGQLPLDAAEKLHQRGIRCIPTLRMPSLGGALAYHPDMQLLHVAEGVVVGAPNLDPSFIQGLRDCGIAFYPGEQSPRDPYPSDVLYNTAVIGHYAVLNVKAADPVVIRWLEKTGRKLVPVKQGYAKCSIAIVNKEAIITADAGIAGTLVKQGFDVLKISDSAGILLPEFSHGFFGGTCGLISDAEMVFSGSLESLKEADIVVKFLEKHGIRPISLSQSPLLDVGGFVPLTAV